MTRKPDTILTHAGRDPARFEGAVNVPSYRASTVLFPTVDELRDGYAQRFEKMFYGRYGTPTSRALEQAMAELEGGYRGIATSSGLGAIAGALIAHLAQGDHLLMVDTVYHPTRKFCDTVLADFGIETTYYDPLAAKDIASLMRPNTKAVFTEAPGSLSFEMQDIPAIAKAAHARDAIVMMDNTWATPLYFKAFEKGVDISIHAGTKYVVGHSDAMLGIVTTTERLYKRTKDRISMFGYAAGSEEVYLGLRGLRTMGARLRQHQDTALKLCDWLSHRPEVERLMYPALPGDPGHEIWKRDFTGASGLFGVELVEAPDHAVKAMLDGMTLFGMGFSWGGYESLIVPTTGTIERTATEWTATGQTLRVHAGLEDPDDLIADLDAGLDRFNAARRGA